MVREIVIGKAARTYVAKLPRNRAMQLISKIEQLAETGISGELTNNIRKLKNRAGYRLRVGSYRIVFEIDDRLLAISDVFPRGQGY